MRGLSLTGPLFIARRRPFRFIVKRFTETSKWNDPWFSDLPARFKLLWIFICDHCDQSGVWTVNHRLAEFQLGEKFTIPDALLAFNGRVEVISNGSKWWIKKFVLFQYGKLSKECKPHMPVFECLSRHGISLEEVSQNEIFSNKVDNCKAYSRKFF